MSTNMNANQVNGDNKRIQKNIEDITSIEEFDFEKLDLYRGKTPDDIKQQCLQLCKDYLSGEWIQQTVDTITVTRICGGLTNQLYYCGINEPKITSNIPHEVSIRFYGSKYFNNIDVNVDNERLTDVIIAITVSDNKLGPKIYGIFDKGQIQQFYRHRQFKLEEQRNPNLVDEVFRKLARIHAMDVPIKRSDWIFNDMDHSYRVLFEGDINIREIFEQNNCEYLLKADFKTEIEWLRQLVDKSDSPIVFTHNDFRSSNLMITDTPNETDCSIVVCDFEYSSFGYRGYDFTAIMREWGRKQLDFSVDDIPQDDSVVRPMIEIYVDECQQIFGEQYTRNPINSVDRIIREIKIFHLVYNLFGALLTLKLDVKSQSLFANMKLQFPEMSFKNYLILKKKIIDMNII
ncbi:choline/ethanolamine kinase-like [Oppia nitens]|uniref:choline/ethanolamine kinase-like n=1 Tax=Oppia nitens TaxID=1686743 RepID=UPI0023DA8B8C|nr:choline/ethanolamine kinase-like [Oppia nitens]